MQKNVYTTLTEYLSIHSSVFHFAFHIIGASHDYSIFLNIQTELLVKIKMPHHPTTIRYNDSKWMK